MIVSILNFVAGQNETSQLILSQLPSKYKQFLCMIITCFSCGTFEFIMIDSIYYQSYSIKILINIRCQSFQKLNCQTLQFCILAHMCVAYAIPLALSVVCNPVSNILKLPEIIRISNPYLVQMFIMFLNYAS